VGVLSVADTQPRVWSEEDTQRLNDLAALVMTEINLRLARQEQVELRETTQVELAHQARLTAENVRLLQAEQRARERTERRQAINAALSNAVTPEQVAQVIVEQAVDAFGAVAGGAGVVSQDRTTIHALHTIGYPPATVQELANIPIKAGIPATEAARTGQLIVLETAEERQRLFPVLGQTSEAQTAYASVIALPLMAEGRVIGVLGLNFTEYRQFSAEDRAFLHALSEQCAQALERARLYREAEDAIKIREDFMSIASHELKTPLTSLTLMIQSLRRQAQTGALAALPPERLLKTLAMAGGQLERLTRLVTDLMDTGRIGAGRLELTMEEGDLVDIAREVVERYADEAQAVGSRVELTACQPVTGRWDQARLDQVVTNLLSNAVKYGGGQPIEVKVVVDGPLARLTVIDHGIGIPAERLATIFDRFERAVSARHFSGLGLGLYITRQIVEAHAGRIWVESQPDAGSTFTVELPRSGERS
jgi:signal transduction histidine kinase